jgi:hypothetical protein
MECQMKTTHTSEQVDEGYAFLLASSHVKSVPDAVPSYNRKKCRKGTFALQSGKGA